MHSVPSVTGNAPNADSEGDGDEDAIGMIRIMLFLTVRLKMAGQ